MRGAALLAIAAVLCGCGGAAAARPTPRPKAPATGTVRVCSDRPHTLDAIKRFNARQDHPGLKAVYVDTASLSYTAYLQGLRDMLARHRCDALELPDTQVPNLVRSHSVYDISAYVNARAHEFFPATLAYGSYRGRHFSVPEEAAVTLLYSHRGSPPPGTWRALLLDSGTHATALASGVGGKLTDAFLELALAQGGQVLTAGGRHSALESSADRAALTLLRDAYRRRALVGNLQTTADAAYASFVRSGSPSSFMLDDAYVARRLTTSRDDSGSLAIQASSVPSHPLVWGGDFVVPVGARAPRAALRVIDVLTSEAEANRTVQHGTPSALVASYDDPAFQQIEPAYGVMKSSLLEAVPYPVTPIFNQLVQEIYRAAYLAVSGRMSVTAALREASDRIDPELERWETTPAWEASHPFKVLR